MEEKTTDSSRGDFPMRPAQAFFKQSVDLTDLNQTETTGSQIQG